MPPRPPTIDRRPVPARNTRLAQRVAAALSRAGVAPNLISASTIGFGLLAGGAFAATSWTSSHVGAALFFVLAALCMQARLLANLFDGMVALARAEPPHPTGALWNELPDRAADAVILVGAGFAVGGSPTLGWLAALMAVLTAYVRAQGAACGARQHFEGPMAKPQRMALMTVAALIAAVLPPSLHAELTGFFRDGPTALDASGVAAADRGIPCGVIGAALAIVILGCAVTIWRRLVGIARDLNSDSHSLPGRERT